MDHDRTTTCGFACDGDIARITAELGDVGLHPLHGKVLIQDASVDDAIAVHLVGSKEAKGAETVLDGDADKVVVVGVDERGKVVLSVACAVSTAVMGARMAEVSELQRRERDETRQLYIPMDPKHDGQTTSILRGKDVEEEAILVVTLVLFAGLELRIAKGVLRTLRAVLASIDDLIAIEQRRLGSLPSKIASRGSGEADTFP